MSSVVDAGFDQFKEWLNDRRTIEDRAQRAWKVIRNFVFGPFHIYFHRAIKGREYLPVYGADPTNTDPNVVKFIKLPKQVRRKVIYHYYSPQISHLRTVLWPNFFDYFDAWRNEQALRKHNIKRTKSMREF